MLKKLDSLLIKSYLPPFVVTFFIALFVLMMQFLWLYIDDIAGKGAGMGLVLKVLFYSSVSLIPMALPIAVLISSVMVMGNLAERYELASFKSAGVPLLRIMMPLIFISFLISIFSFLSSNFFIPYANYQFKTLLYDIRKHKPTLNMEVQTFNDDFKDFTIYIGAKGSDNKSIEDVIIYDHTSFNRNRSNMLTAKRGEMFTTKDDRFFVMKLYNGTQYRENKENTKADKKTKPFTRTHFEEWTKVFDLAEFDIKHTDPELFKAHHTMLSIRQLRVAADSIESKISKREKDLTAYSSNYFYRQKMRLDSIRELKKTELTDTSKVKVNKKLPGKHPTAGKPKSVTLKIQDQIEDIDLNKVDHFYETQPIFFRASNMNRVRSNIKNIIDQSASALSMIGRQKEKRVKHIFELHIKFSYAIVCMIFLFIGAPMGAIVRKGGFGYPLLIAIIFFMLYIVLNILFKKLAESLVIEPGLAAWMPCLILSPLGGLLTYKAMMDSKMLDIDRLTHWFKRKFGKKETTLTN